MRSSSSPSTYLSTFPDSLSPVPLPCCIPIYCQHLVNPIICPQSQKCLLLSSRILAANIWAQ
jgi:hypothetical protein